MFFYLSSKKNKCIFELNKENHFKKITKTKKI